MLIASCETSPETLFCHTMEEAPRVCSKIKNYLDPPVTPSSHFSSSLTSVVESFFTCILK